MERFVRVVSVGVLGLLLTSAVAWAQLSTAQLTGRVTDESGAVLPGVTVSATQTDTGASRTAVTDENGNYLLSNLPTGPYRLEVGLQGFRTYVQTGIVLQVASTPTINAVLGVGSLEESVTVEAAAPLVDVKSAGISDVVDNEKIVELPLQGRQVTSLLILAGAAVNTGSPNSRSFQGGVNISVGGGLSFGVAYLLDGAMHNDPQNNANLPLPFPDALQEFRVATSGLSAQNGMHSGASVNAVTKSGTNRFTGNLFEFLRDKRFNAKDPFARIGPDGQRVDDGLKRNQFGGTLGGPIARDKMFFFGAYQGTMIRQTPSANIAYVPTAAMLAGDFSAFTSPACNGGRQVALRAPFVNNQINPASYSPAALNLAKKLPSTTDPCGQITYEVPSDADQGQGLGRLDYQWGSNHSMFGRYMATFDKVPAAFSVSDNILTTSNAGINNLAQSFTFGDTMVLGPSVVNSLRVAFNRTAIDRYNPAFFDPKDLGSNVHSYNPDEMVFSVTGGFNISAGTATKGVFKTNSYQLADDITFVRGAHQLGIGVNMAYWKSNQLSHARSGGNWIVNGQATGLGLADFLVGRISSLEHGGPALLHMDMWYLGLYVQDSWTLTRRVTVNGGIRWEPYFGQNILNGAIANFDIGNFRAGTRSTVFRNAPAGLLYPGDAGFPDGKTGLNNQWWNLSPRVGVAWDVNGDGRTAVRASYGLAYDFQSGDYHNINASAPPFGNRSSISDPTGLFDDPYRSVGGDPHPIVTGPNTQFPAFGAFGVLDPNVNSPRVQTWNVTLERQFGSTWGASVSYLGSYSDRLWNQVAINPGVFMGLGPCAINGVAYTVCTTNANLNNRRALSLENPREGGLIGAMDLHDDVGTQGYRAIKFSAQRRAAGVSFTGNYTLGRCTGNATPGSFPQLSSGFTNPADPEFDRGHCDQDRTHLANFTAGAQTPQFDNPALRILASGWRMSGIFSVRSGAWMNVITGLDNAFNGVNAQRPNQVSDDVYGEKTLINYLNRAAFAMPAAGTFGDLERNGVEGPGFHTVDVALSRLIPLGGSQSIEARVEAFNLFNTFNWGNPNLNFNSGTFGRITTNAGAQRIMQFGVKYSF